MADRIGPTFGAELNAAGCADGVAWASAGTLYLDPSLTASQIVAVEAVLAAHDPTKQPAVDVPGDAIVGVLSRAQAAQCDVRDLARIAWRDDVPATNNKLKRIADAIGSTPDALRQQAMGN